jgi:tRNA pseudouridine55 synthase
MALVADKAFFDASAGIPLERTIDAYPEGIILPVDKPYRWTSADVIRKVKYAAIKHFGKKNLKVGHAGTLDPLATGVLLVCIGAATRQAETLQKHDKEYLAGIAFGATTPSYDREKEIDRFFPYEHITAQAIEAVLPQFLGEQEQVAPLFSAKSVDGQRAYELARKLYREHRDNTEAAAQLSRQRITIHSLRLEAFQPAGTPSETGRQLAETRPRCAVPARSAAEMLAGPCPGGALSAEAAGASNRIRVTDNSALGLPVATIRIACTKGTYIRAFARDLGEALGSGAHLESLCRTRTGDFSISNALSLEQALALLDAVPNQLKTNILP